VGKGKRCSRCVSWRGSKILFEDLGSTKPLNTLWSSERRDKDSTFLPLFPSMPQLRAKRKPDQAGYEGGEPRGVHSSFQSPHPLINTSVFAM